MLAVVIAIFFAFAWILRRANGLRPQGNSDLKVTAGISIGQRERLVIVEADGQRLLVGVTPASIQTLHVLGEAPLPPSDNHPGATKTPGFGESFKQVLAARMGGNNER